MGLRRPKTNKNPPIFSHEFVIQNHADIVSCVAMVFVIGLMFQATNPVASLFVAMQHNITLNDTATELTNYSYGMKDVFSVFFYLLIAIVFHAVIQEYILDKLGRKMHLSKVKHSKFNESGQLLTFYLFSAGWGTHIMIGGKTQLMENQVLNIASLWEGYPEGHAQLPFIVKFFFIIQMAYWLHCLPELYFQKIKKDEMPARIQYCLLYLVFIVTAYVLNFTRVAMAMIVLHYFVEFVFHVSRILYFAEKTEFANTGFTVWFVLFVLVRLGTITLAVLTFWYGLQQNSQSSIDFATGNFNTQIIRINCLAAVCLMQAWMMWNFITFHLRRMRQHGQGSGGARSKVVSPKRREKKIKAKREDDTSDSADVDSTDTTENGVVRSRTKKRI